MAAEFDVIVVGAGAGGVGIAELLQRSGRSVLLLEARDKIGAESSAQQQGWFHTGPLYAALPDSVFFRKLVANLDVLFNYYADFPGMNLARGASLRCTRPEGWFRNVTNYYGYVDPRSLPLSWRPWWSLATLRAKTRLAWFEGLDFSRELAPQMRTLCLGFPPSRCVAQRTFDFNLDGIGCVLVSHDRAMHGETVLGDLLRSFLGAGGRLHLNTRAVRIEKGAVVTDGRTFTARSVVVTAGKETGRLTGVKVRVFKSPILVVKPALTDVNFIRMTPILRDTLSHIHHDSAAGAYSAIGNASGIPADTHVVIPTVHADLVRRVNQALGTAIEPSETQLYFGYKTEIPRRGRFRDYQDQVIDAGSCVVALPGKMSLMFTLAVRVCRHLGIDPAAEVCSLAEPVDGALVSDSEHLQRCVRMARFPHAA